MPLTLQTAYSNATKTKNITETWLVDLYGDVDSGYTLDEEVSVDETSSIQLNPRVTSSNSASSAAIEADLPTGQHIRINNEIMAITSQQHVSGSLISVTRAQGGTIQGTHADDSKLFTVSNISLATSDVTVGGIPYVGCIKNQPSIRTSISLDKMTSSTNNITIEIPNFNYNGSIISKELINGSKTYLNRFARITSVLNNESSLANGSTVFSGRITKIKLINQGDAISIELESFEPWHRLTFPQDKTAINNVYIPVAYGNYAANSDEHKVREANKKVHPVPVVRLANPEILLAMPQAYSDIRIHLYEKSMDSFVQLNNASYTAATVDKSNGYDVNTNIGIVDMSLRRRFACSPLSVSSSVGVDQWSLSKNLLLHSYSTQGATSSYTQTNSAGGNQSHKVHFNFPQIVGKYNALKIISRGSIVWAGNGATTFFDLEVGYLEQDGSFAYGNYYDTSSNASSATKTLGANLGAASSIYGDLYQELDALTVFNNNNMQLPPIQLHMEYTSGSLIASTTTIKDFLMYFDVESDFSSDEKSATSYTNIEKIDYMYCGTSGLTESYSGSAVAAHHGHEVHRDLLVRFGGIATTTPDGWDTSFHDSSETGGGLHDKRHVDNYAIRYWELEPVSLKDKLDKLAYEFNFIFKFRPDGTLAYLMPGAGNGSNSAYQAGDVAATITQHDIERNSFEYTQTEINDLITKITINNEKHPEVSNQNKYLTTTESLNATSREKFAFNDKENVLDVNLDMNVGTFATTPAADHNTDFYSYVDHLHGDIKDIVSCVIVNPDIAYKLETGDIILFTDMIYDPGNDSWDNKYFMITNLIRFIGKVKISAREVS
jgi:hypothetical protein